MNSEIILRHTHWQLSPLNEAQPIQGEDDLHQCIATILSTRKGSDVLRPTFGSSHFDYLDQPFDIAVPNMVREIFMALSQWEKRIEVQAVKVSGLAPHFHFEIVWVVKDEVARQIYTTYFSQGASHAN
ncbi:phage baseplate protein [Pasteurellaceae bacterium RH1A]|nr:phage baseplate protein [Pasteurellaceae bacterium RH1A]